VAALPSNAVTKFLKDFHGVALADSRNSRHELDEHISLLNAPQTGVLGLNF
jgi:hypothetical protein